MKKFINKLGLICLEADEGYLLKKGAQTFKKAILNKNDRVELYEEVIDKDYVNLKEIIENEEIEEEVMLESYYILTSPSGKKFKLTISDDGELDVEKI